MATDTFNFFNEFTNDLANKAHDLLGATDTMRIALTNTAPVGTETGFDVTDFPAPAAANGYTAGGNTATYTGASATGTVTVSLTGGNVFTASGGDIGPFQYIIFYNDSATSPVDAYIGWLDHGGPVTLNSGDTYTINTGSLFTIDFTNP